MRDNKEESFFDNKGNSELQSALYGNAKSLQHIRQLIESYRADPRLFSLNDAGYSVLHTACFRQNVVILKYLLESFYTECARFIDSQENLALRTPLHVACWNTRIDHALFLLQAGAKVFLKDGRQQYAHEMLAITAKNAPIEWAAIPMDKKAQLFDAILYRYDQQKGDKNELERTTFKITLSKSFPRLWKERTSPLAKQPAKRKTASSPLPLDNKRARRNLNSPNGGFSVPTLNSGRGAQNQEQSLEYKYGRLKTSYFRLEKELKLMRAQFNKPLKGLRLYKTRSEQLDHILKQKEEAYQQLQVANQELQLKYNENQDTFREKNQYFVQQLEEINTLLESATSDSSEEVALQKNQNAMLEKHLALVKKKAKEKSKGAQEKIGFFLKDNDALLNGIKLRDNIIDEQKKEIQRLKDALEEPTEYDYNTPNGNPF